MVLQIALRFNIPPNATKQCVSRGGQRCEVRRCRTGDKPASALRQARWKRSLSQRNATVSSAALVGEVMTRPAFLVPRGCKPVCRHRPGSDPPSRIEKIVRRPTPLWPANRFHPVRRVPPRRSMYVRGNCSNLLSAAIASLGGCD